MKPITFTSFLLAVAFVPAIASAHPAVAQVDVSQVITGDFNSTFISTQARTTPANIVISVRDFSQTDTFCGSSMGIAFPYPGSLGEGFDFPHAGRQSDIFPHPGRTITSFAGSATTYFQLPPGARNPDLIGCVDTQRNTVFITIKPQRQTSPAPQPQPPVQPPSTPTPSNNPTLTYPQTQLLLPQPKQSFPTGVSPNNPSVH